MELNSSCGSPITSVLVAAHKIVVNFISVLGFLF